MPFWDKIELELQNLQDEFKQAKHLTDTTYAEYRHKLEECARYKTALEWYANKANYFRSAEHSPVTLDYGEKAREALAIPCRHHWVSIFDDVGILPYVPGEGPATMTPVKARCNKCGVMYNAI